jgi:hypothetical protein
MTSRKTKQQRLQEGRLRRARLQAGIDPSKEGRIPAGAVAADPQRLAHNNTYGPLPRFYVDKLIVCRQCAKEEVWPAERQKWWYEVAQGSIHSQAVLCRSCRRAEREKSAQVRKLHLEGVARKRGTQRSK